MIYVGPILVILLLLTLNALFVAAEFALIGVPRATIERRAAGGHRIARLVAGILSNPRLQDQYIATAQLGITFASLGLGMYGEHILAEWIGWWFKTIGSPVPLHAEHLLASVLAIAFLTYFHIVLGEMVPKTLALQHAEATSLWVTPWMRWIRGGLYPLVLALNSIGNRLLRLAGIDRSAATQHYHTPEELELIIDESEGGGVLDERSATLMRELLSLRETTAGELMIPRVRVTGLSANASAAEMQSVLTRASHTRYPVYEGSLDTIIGVVHVKDLLPLLVSGRDLAREYVRAVPFVPHTISVGDVVDSMRTTEVQMAVVMDEYGGTAGIITEKDLLDELVGEIHEDVEQGEIWRDAQARLHVAGTVLLADVGEEIEIDLEHEEVVQMDWVNWKRAFVDLPVTLTKGNNSDINGLLGTHTIVDSIPLKWRDQFVVRVGLEKSWLESAKVRVGYAHATNPVPESTLSPLTAAITRNTVSAGVG